MEKKKELSQDLFIAVDGGATKTIVRVENAQGELLGEARGGAANIRLSVENSWRSILDALSKALAQADLPLDEKRYRYYCGTGLAGTEIASARKRFLNTPHPCARLLLKTDAYTSCLGAHNGRDGAVIAIGTGVVAYKIEGGRERQVSGWGFPHGDEGSGAWLGLESLRLTLQWQDGRVEASPLLQSVFEHFDGDMERMVIWANQANATQFAQLAPLVIEHVKFGTPLALGLIQQAAREIDRIGAAVLADSVAPNLPCSLVGGLAPFIEPWLGEALRERLVPKQYDAIHGAMLMIRRVVQTAS